MNQLKHQVIEILIEHVRITMNSMKEMHLFYKLWTEARDKKEINEKKEEINNLEEQADELKVRIIKKFAEAESQGLSTLLDLVLKTDGILNYINEFTDRILYIDKKLSKNINKRINSIIKKSIEMGEALTWAVKSLLGPREKAFDTSKKLHLLEHEIDSEYRDFENYLYDSTDLDLITILKVKGAVQKIEEMADLIENIADLIRIIAYS
ncbi:MAG: DUF47 family protein [Candidatus Lokiarchaeota archaeon]|nr:DUF47 family protein [Candidatus Lokiarchaeota archaeon]